MFLAQLIQILVNRVVDEVYQICLCMKLLIGPRVY